jgi:hypothetical protein
VKARTDCPSSGASGKAYSTRSGAPAIASGSQHRDAGELAVAATSRPGGFVDAYVGVKPLIASAFDAVDQTAGEGKVAKARRR